MCLLYIQNGVSSYENLCSEVSYNKSSAYTEKYSKTYSANHFFRHMMRNSIFGHAYIRLEKNTESLLCTTTELRLTYMRKERTDFFHTILWRIRRSLIDIKSLNVANVFWRDSGHSSGGARQKWTAWLPIHALAYATRVNNKPSTAMRIL